MKTSELTGIALDWAVARAKGYADFVLDARRFMEMHETGHYNYSTEWAQGGPIIEREAMTIAFDAFGWGARHYDGESEPTITTGESPLIAAMRCYVVSKLGDEIELPFGLKG